MPRDRTSPGEVMKILRGTMLVAIMTAPFPSASVEAQVTARPLVQIERPSRWTIGGGFVVSQPKGDSAENINGGFGVDGYGLFKLDKTGFLSLRADVGGSEYGSETLPAAYAYGGRG